MTEREKREKKKIKTTNKIFEIKDELRQLNDILDNGKCSMEDFNEIMKKIRSKEHQVYLLRKSVNLA